MEQTQSSHLPVRFLETKNLVPGTETLTFQDEGHRYTAKSKYYDDTIFSTDKDSSIPIISTTTVIKPYFPDTFHNLACKLFVDNQDRIAEDPTYKYFGVTCVQDIKDIWSKGATLGTKMHAHFEDLCNLIEHDKHNKDAQFLQVYEKTVLENQNFSEKQYFFDFVKKFNLYDPNGRFSIHRTELMMFHDALMISGMIDCLMYDKEQDAYVIVDWKRCKGGVKGDPVRPRKQVRELPPDARGCGLPSFEKLRNHSYNKYGCQLTLYKNVLEYMTGKKVTAMILVVVDANKIGKPNALEYISIPIDKFQEQIDGVFRARAEHILGNHEHLITDAHMDDLIAFTKDKHIVEVNNNNNKRQKIN